MAGAWSSEENEEAVADYFDMWSAYLRGQKYSKAEHWRRLQGILKVRSKGAIEKKHGNISAALHDLGRPSLPGYQPYGNYQHVLRETVEAHLAARPDIDALLSQDAGRHVAMTGSVDALSALTEVPSRGKKVRKAKRVRPVGPPPSVNYLEIQARNNALGLAGEDLVVQYERQKLGRVGKEALAARVEHVAVTRGSSAGFDVLSFEESGEERFIEVKTTTWGRETPFYVTAHECAFSEAHHDQYRLYRLFDFRRAPEPSAKRLTLRGPISTSCVLLPTVYRASVS